MTAVKQDDSVRVHYTGTLADGTQFDTSIGAEPLEVKVGSGQVISGFDTALTGMRAGETKTVELTVEDAYGEIIPELIQEVSRAEIPEDIELHAGLQLQVEGPDGQPLVLTVTELMDDNVTLDGNHPLAGQALTFDLELIEIVT